MKVVVDGEQAKMMADVGVEEEVEVEIANMLSSRWVSQGMAVPTIAI